MFFIYSNSIMYGKFFFGREGPPWNGREGVGCLRLRARAGVDSFQRKRLAWSASGICQRRAILYWNANQKLGKKHVLEWGSVGGIGGNGRGERGLLRLETQSGASRPLGLPSLFFQHGGAASR